MRRALVLVILAQAAILPVACSSKKPNPPMSPQSSLGDAGAGDASAEGGAAGWGDGGVIGGFGGIGGDAGLAGGDAGLGVPATLAAATDALIDVEIAKIAAKVAPGMAPEGQAYRDTLATNGHLNAIITLQPNRCYTIIGFSPKEGGVSQLDMQLLAPPLFNFATNRAASPKNEAIIGKGKEALCPVSLVPLPYKIDAIASKGAGRIAVVVYAKNK